MGATRNRYCTPVIALLLGLTYLPTAIATVEHRMWCFASYFYPSKRQSTELGVRYDSKDRRSFLLRKSFEVSLALSLLVTAPAYSVGAEVSGEKYCGRPSTKTTTPMNFPRVHPGLRVGNPNSGVQCEMFLDFACPYSRKLFAAVSEVSGSYEGSMSFVYHNVIQPWHHQSLWLHESSFAVRVLYPEAEIAYWRALFDDAPKWYDNEIYGLTRGEFYERIAAFAADAVVASEGTTGLGGELLSRERVKGRILQYLIPPKQEGGKYPEEARTLLGSGPDDDENAVFPLTKQIVKFQRKRGVHVTPTVFFNGIEQTQVSSGWTANDWTEFLNHAVG